LNAVYCFCKADNVFIYSYFILDPAALLGLVAVSAACLSQDPSRFRRGGETQKTSLHIWLKEYCSSAGITFADTFDNFWKQKIFYRNDRVHPNPLGSWTLSMYFRAALKQ
jgi:hypothetical protein